MEAFRVMCWLLEGETDNLKGEGDVADGCAWVRGVASKLNTRMKKVGNSVLRIHLLFAMVMLLSGSDW